MRVDEIIEQGMDPSGQYALLEVMGDPGHEVFRAQAGDGQPVVLRYWRGRSEFETRAAVELCENAMRLRHPMLASVYGCDRFADGSVRVVTEYVAGRSLDAWLGEHGVPPLRIAVDFVRRLAMILQHVHGHGVTHHALYPGNIVVLEPTRPEGRVPAKLLDLGVHRAMHGPTRFEAAHFMAPEALATELRAPTHALAIDVRMNVYSCGCLLHYLCTGELPYQSDSLQGLSMLHREARPPQPGRINPHLPVELEYVIVRALELDPRRRTAGMAELARGLSYVESLWRASGVRPKVSPPPLPKRERATEPRRLAPAIAAALALRPVPLKRGQVAAPPPPPPPLGDHVTIAPAPKIFLRGAKPEADAGRVDLPLTAASQSADEPAVESAADEVVTSQVERLLEPIVDEAVTAEVEQLPGAIAEEAVTAEVERLPGAAIAEEAVTAEVERLAASERAVAIEKVAPEAGAEVEVAGGAEVAAAEIAQATELVESQAASAVGAESVELASVEPTAEVASVEPTAEVARAEEFVESEAEGSAVAAEPIEAASVEPVAEVANVEPAVGAESPEIASSAEVANVEPTAEVARAEGLIEADAASAPGAESPEVASSALAAAVVSAEPEVARAEDLVESEPMAALGVESLEVAQVAAAAEVASVGEHAQVAGTAELVEIAHVVDAASDGVDPESVASVAPDSDAAPEIDAHATSAGDLGDVVANSLEPQAGEAESHSAEATAESGARASANTPAPPSTQSSTARVGADDPTTVLPPARGADADAANAGFDDSLSLEDAEEVGSPPRRVLVTPVVTLEPPPPPPPAPRPAAASGKTPRPTPPRREEPKPEPRVRNSLSPVEIAARRSGELPKSVVQDVVLPIRTPKRTSQHWGWVAAALALLCAYTTAVTLRSNPEPVVAPPPAPLAAAPQAAPPRHELILPTELEPSEVAEPEPAPTPAPPAKAHVSTQPVREPPRAAHVERRAPNAVRTQVTSPPSAAPTPVDPLDTLSVELPPPSVRIGFEPVTAAAPRVVRLEPVWRSPNVIAFSERPGPQQMATAGPVRGSVRTESVETSGALTQAQANHAIDRIQPQLRQCYVDHGPSRPARIQVELIIDDVGRVRNLQVRGAAAPFAECVVQVSRKLMSGLPYTGAAKVSWGVSFE